MIRVNEVVVAVGGSAIAAAVVLLLVYLAGRGARIARARLPIQPIHEARGRVAEIGRDLFARDATDGGPSSERRTRRLRACAACLATSSGLAVVGTFLPLYNDPNARGGSFRLYDTMHDTAIVWVITLAVPLCLASLMLARRNRLVAALVVGYCAPAVGGLATYAMSLTISGDAHTSAGSGYYFLTAGNAAQAGALLFAASLVFTGAAGLARPKARSVRLAVLAAVLLAISATLRLERFPGLSIWQFDRLPVRLDAALVVGLVGVALIPVIAMRAGTRAAALMTLGLAVAQALFASDAVIARLSLVIARLSLSRFTQLTAGFWITMLAVATLVVLGLSLRQSVDPVGAAPLTPAGGLAS